MIVESVAQSVVSRNATSHCHMLNACLLNGKTKFLHQYVDDSVLKTCCKVVLVMLHKVGVVLNPLAQTIKERSLQSAETIVQTRNVRFCKLICERIALTCQAVDNRATRIAQSHNLRALVNGLASCVVNSLSEHLHIVIGVHLDYLRITARNEQTEERERRCSILWFLLDEMRHHMTLQVVHVNHRNAQTAGKSLGEAHTYKQ